MEDVILAQPLTNLQMELLRLYSLRLTTDDLLEVKEVLAQHFAQRLTEHVDSLWQERAWTADTMEDWLNDVGCRKWDVGSGSRSQQSALIR